MSSKDKFTESDPERTLLTLDQLSQTIEVMTSVVNRLRQHLSEQIMARKAQEQAQRECPEADTTAMEAFDSEPAVVITEEAQGSVIEISCPATSEDRESFVVEISQPEAEAQPKPNKVLH